MKIREGKIIIGSIIIVFIISICITAIYGEANRKVDREKLISNKEIRNNECGIVYENMDESEEKYKKLLETEEDSFMRGVYSSALATFYLFIGDYDKVIEYEEKAVENYNKVENGEFYSIMEKKYFAWAMLSQDKYAESFLITSQLLEMINESGNEVLIEQDIIDTKACIYSIFLFIYSEMDILDKAELYYNKLCELESEYNITPVEEAKILYSKYGYAGKIEDLELLKEAAYGIYEIDLKHDEENGTNGAHGSVINVANVNINLGEFEIAFEQIQKSEEFYTNIGDNYGIGAVYSAYSEYYNAVNENELAIEYYKKAMYLFNEFGNKNLLKKIMNNFIIFLRENDTNEDIYKYYEYMYNLSEESDADKSVNELLSQIIDINDKLNSTSLLLLEREARESKNRVIVAILVIILLGVMIIRMYYLINEKNKTEKILEEIANKDYLTGVSTRAYGEKLILDEINNGKELSIGIIDIDNFKNINDTYGHTFGDIILKSVAKEIRESIGKNDVVIRFGGEEFIVAFIDKDKEEGKKILDKIRIDVNNIVFENNVRVSFSGGIVNWDKTNIYLVIKKSDELLYKAKREGKNMIISS